MATLDWILVAIVAASAVSGLMRGFVSAAASLMAWLLSGWAALHFGSEAGFLLASDGTPGVGEVFAGYVLCFVVVMVVVGLAGWAVARLVESAGLSGVDRLLGLGLGLARGALAGCILVLLLALTTLPREPSWRDSAVLPAFLPGVQLMRAWLPDWVAAQVDLGHRSPGVTPEAALPAPVGG